MIEKKLKAVLTIAGSDSSGGAGIQADLKTFIANGVYGMSAITAITAQNTLGVDAVMDVTPDILAAQLDAVFKDIPPDAVKIGMVSSVALIDMIDDRLRRYNAQHVVLDPVMISTSGSKLISDDAIGALKNLFRLAEVITPNMFELAALTNQPADAIHDKNSMETSARSLFDEYGCAVLAKGGHFHSVATDLLCDADGFRWFFGDHIKTKNTHGTGCTLSSAIAANLAKRHSLAESINAAKKYLSEALSTGLSIGHGNGPLDHGFKI